MSDELERCKHGRRFCFECHGVIRDKPGEPPLFICSVFGCTIPNGMPHTHRTWDPLDKAERSELERLRRQLHASAVEAERRAMVPPRHTFVKIVGRICLMIAIAFGLSSALVLIAMSAGWL